MERIVGRSELISEDSASSISPEPETREILMQVEDIEFVEASIVADPHNYQNDDQMDASDDEGYEFRLFGNARDTNRSSSAAGLQKIKLRSPPVSKADAGLIQPERNRSYYFARQLSADEKEQFRSAAVNGEQVLAQARRPWPGSSYPWKVLHLPLSNVKPSIRAEESKSFQTLVDDSLQPRRKRPGKKSRIKIRQKQAALKAKRDAKNAAVEAKEAAQRETRARRNREKKAKKRMRDKVKASAATASIATPSIDNSPNAPSSRPGLTSH